MDLLGLDLEEAKALLGEQGISPEIRRTCPPKGEVEAGIEKVIGQKQEGDRSILTVCKAPDPFR